MTVQEARQRFSISRILAPRPHGDGGEAAPNDASARTPVLAAQEVMRPVLSLPKRKRSYSVDAMLCQDLEALAWYSEESASGIVEELIRTHLTTNADLLAKAKEARTVSQAARQSVGAM